MYEGSATKKQEVQQPPEVCIGDLVRVKKGCCGEGHKFVVVERGLSGHGEPIVFGANYGPVRTADLERLPPGITGTVHPCCGQAVRKPCVCQISWQCPIHGGWCVGSHD